MKFSLALLVAFCSGSAHGACTAPGTLTCMRTDETPTLDAKLDEWASVTGGIETDMVMALSGVTYAGGSSSYKCLYDDTYLYLAMEIPGAYRFNDTDNHMCAAIATMMKIGADATFIGMGGCPLASSGCSNDTIASSCESYTVDIGAHWELSTTQQGVRYDLNVDNSGNDASNDPGNDLIANKDDEYGVNPYCRFDDNDANAGNEWSGAWSHTNNSTDGASGTYIFELSRLLKTKSTVSDAQLAPGQTIDFGIAYWDPNEIADSGWSDSGHYTTGCGTEWIKLVLSGSTNSTSTSAANILLPLAALGISCFMGVMNI